MHTPSFVLLVRAGVFALAAVALALMPVESVAAAPAVDGCDYADSGSGTYASTICWIDFSDFDFAAASSASGQPMTVALPGGYAASFTLTARPVVGYADLSSCVVASFAPMDGLAKVPLGGLAYTGIAGMPALLNTATPGCFGPQTAVTVSLESIRVRDATGADVTDYGVVSTEAEKSGPRESIAWTSDSVLTRLDEINPGGQGCVGTNLSGLGTTTASCTGVVGASWATSLILAESPSRFSTSSFSPNRYLGTAYGFVTSKVRVSAHLVDGIGDFSVTAVSGGDPIAEGAMSNDDASTGEVTVLTGGSFALGVTAINGTRMSDYHISWSCLRNGALDPSLSSPGSVVTAVPAIGDFVDCTANLTPSAPVLTLVKSATPLDPAEFVPGATISYRFEVTNAGNATVSGLSVAETAFSGSGTPPIPACPSPTLTAGTTMTCVATYVLTQEDIDSGQVTNTAQASGDASGEPVTSNTSSVAIPATQSAMLTLVKTVTPTLVRATGDQVAYSFVVTNVGNVTLTGVGVDEVYFGGNGGVPVVSCPANRLAPSATMTCTANYAVDVIDMQMPVITNVAGAHGITPAGVTISSATDEATFGNTFRARILPTFPGDGLAMTGGDPAPAAMAGVAAIALGAGLLLLAGPRRARRSASRRGPRLHSVVAKSPA